MCGSAIATEYVRLELINNNQSLLMMVVQAAVTKAAPNYMPLARQANKNAVLRIGRGLPAGPYNVEQYQNDLDSF